MKNTFVKIILAILIVPTLSIVGYIGYLNYLAPVPEVLPTPTPTPEVAIDEPEIISAEGKVVPNGYVQLNFRIPGMVESVEVDQGDSVKKGDVLAILKGREQLDAAIAGANLELISAEQALNNLYDHHDLLAAQSKQAVVEAQEEVDEANRILRNANYIPTQEQIEAAEASVVLAEQNLKAAQIRLSAYENRPDDDPQKAAAQLSVYQAEQRLYDAQNTVAALTSGPDPLDIARAEANLAVKEAQLDEAKKNALILEEGPFPDNVELAEAQVATAKAALSASKANLEDLTLIAPISGEVIYLNLKEGEVVNPGLPLIILADLSVWQIKTTDLSEKIVALLTTGIEATITLNAFPGQKFEGVISKIDLLGEESRGEVNYVVTIDFDPGETPLRWEMSAFVEITIP